MRTSPARSPRCSPYLRELQRAHQLAVVVVHHARKGAARARAGQALRGSSEFHAWGDSNLYLRRVGEHLTLTVEQRAAAPIAGITLALEAQGDALALRVIDRRGEPDAPTRAPSLQGPGRASPRRDDRATHRGRDPALLPHPHRDALRDPRRPRRPGPNPAYSCRLSPGRPVAFPPRRFPAIPTPCGKRKRETHREA